MATRRPPEVFAQEYVLLDERIAGGQAIVNFARDAATGAHRYAIKCVADAVAIALDLPCPFSCLGHAC